MGLIPVKNTRIKGNVIYLLPLTACDEFSRIELTESTGFLFIFPL